MRALLEVEIVEAAALTEGRPADTFYGAARHDSLQFCKTVEGVGFT